MAQLYQYLAPKVHPAIGPFVESERASQTIGASDSPLWNTIIVKGLYRREPLAVLSSSEKRERSFNWQRPTAERLDEHTLQVNCFPGNDYVRHNASVIARFLSLRPLTSIPKVQYILPALPECPEIFLRSNLQSMSQCDVVIVGYLDHHPGHSFLKSTIQKTPSVKENAIFNWYRFNIDNGRTGAYLGCAFSIWGDISGHLVRALHTLNGAKCIIYVGKLGCLEERSPNEYLATGSRSFIQTQDGIINEVTWKNPLAGSLKASPKVLQGDHVTVPSPLCENREWLECWKPKCRWVDCEIYHMARAAKDSGIDFGYLHFISDSFSGGYLDNLANEDDTSVQEKRTELFKEIDKVLEKFLQDY